ncbi:MAG: thioesterase II family protein [Cyanobacteria bacterium J06643_5]
MDSWITFPKPNPKANVRLFCFPYAGGSSSIFRLWQDLLPANIELCPVELPGRGSKIKLAPLNRLESIIKELSQQIQPYLDKPFSFFGHSMGGLLSFELTRNLYQKYGINPVHLFISALSAPQIIDSKPPIHNLSESDFIDKLRDYNGTPNEVLEDEELMALFLPVLRADFAVIGTYTYYNAPPLECPISIFGGLEDDKVPIEELEAWRTQTNNSFSLEIFPGGHFFINDLYLLLIEKISEVLKN